MMQKPICFIGHTHYTGVFIQDNNGKITYESKVKFKLKEDYHCIVYVGSIGQPRDGDSRSSFCVYDTSTSQVWVKRLDYDVELA